MFMSKRALRARDEVGESREMHVHPNMSITIHRQNRPASNQQLPIQYLPREFSHPNVRFQGNDAHLEEDGLEGWRGMFVIIPSHLPNREDGITGLRILPAPSSV